MERSGGTTEENIPADQPGPGVSIASAPATPDTVSGQVFGSVGDVLGEAWAQLTGAAASGGNKLKDALVNMGIPEGDADYYQNEFGAGRHIPDVVAVIGFDDIEDSRLSTPALTTIALDKEKIGKLAVSFLLGRIDGTRTVQPERVEVPFHLIVRESTVDLKGR